MPYRNTIPLTALRLLLGLVGALAPARAEVSSPAIFGHNMVLQQGMPVPVWGRANPGEKVVVTFGRHAGETVTGPDGRWIIRLGALQASTTPEILTVRGENTLTFTNVLVGDVWLCSGQSNMEYGYQNLPATGQVVEAGIRTFCVLKSASLTPLDELYCVPEEIGLDTQMGHWQVQYPGGSWSGFSAVGYHFGKEIHRYTQQPVGLIGSYWGGTPAQAWISLSALEKEPRLSHYVEGVRQMSDEQKARFPVRWTDYVAALRRWDRESREPYEQARRVWTEAAEKARAAGHPEPPEPKMAFPRPANPGNVGTTTSLFNGMIHPLIPYALKGVIWYQGEANAYNGAEYGTLFPVLINDWRERWGEGSFPFLFVQIAGYGVSTNDPTRGQWASLREGQRQALALTNVAMAVAIDVGDKRDIHPKNKLPVARRLALAARHLAYGENLVYSGPVYDSMKVDGHGIRVSFSHIGSGLVAGGASRPQGSPPIPAVELKGFEIAGTNRQWFVAQAAIDGACVNVSCDQVAAPVAVRYAWGDYPACDLYNREGLPAVPFRTDDWDPKAAFATPE